MPFIAPSRRIARNSLSPANGPLHATHAPADEPSKEQPSHTQTPSSVLTHLGESSYDMDSVSPSAAAVGLAAAADAAYLPNDISLLFRPSSAASASSQGDAEVPVESLTAVLMQVRHRCDVNLSFHDTFVATIFLVVKALRCRGLTAASLFVLAPCK